jgi:hypothetical protein
MSRIASSPSNASPAVQLAAAVAPSDGARPTAAAAATTETGAKSAAALAPNPALRMDPELGLVVLEFRDSRGEVAESVPTSRELEAYRRAARTGAPWPAS